jgi:hypothetical protein
MELALDNVQLSTNRAETYNFTSKVSTVTVRLLQTAVGVLQNEQQQRQLHLTSNKPRSKQIKQLNIDVQNKIRIQKM